MIARLAAAALVLFASSFVVPAIAQNAPGGSAPAKAEDPKPVSPPNISTTRHTGTFGGQRVAYSATASETYLKAEDGTPKASIFSIAYVREPRDRSRPVTFLFNGGPGSGSL